MKMFINALSIAYFGRYGWTVLFYLPYIAGLCCIFRKLGTNFVWAFVPFARDYKLAEAVGMKKEGRIYVTFHCFSALMNLMALLSPDSFKIGSYAVSAAAVILALGLIMFLYSIRIYSALIRRFGKRKRWILLWLFFRGIAAMIWGFSKKFEPLADYDPEAAKKTEQSPAETWLGNLIFSLTRKFDWFSYHGDWKILPMSVIIAALVASIARNDFFSTMEGTIKGSLALTCIAIWNGCFNSIRTICREKETIRSLRRKGLHLSAYITSVLLYQVLLCMVETILALYTCRLIGIKFPDEGVFSPALIPELSVTVFLITFAADLVCLCISALVRDSVAAMTVLPFILVINLVFSGSVINVAVWSKTISRYTISNYGVKCIAAQADYNNRPMVMGWTLLNSIRDTEVGTTVTVGQLMDIVQSDDSYPVVAKVRATEVGTVFTPRQVTDSILSVEEVNKAIDADLELDMSVREVIDFMMEKDIIPSYEEIGEMVFSKTFTVKEIYSIVNSLDSIQTIREKLIFNLFDVGSTLDLIISFFEDKAINVNVKLDQVLDFVLEDETVAALLDRRPLQGLTVRKILENPTIKSFYEKYMDKEIDARFTVGEIIDAILSLKEIQNLRGIEINLTAKIDTLINAVGEERVKNFIIEKTSEAVHVDEYVRSRENILRYWRILLLFVLGAGVAAVGLIQLVMRMGSKAEDPEDCGKSDPDNRMDLLPPEDAEEKDGEGDDGKDEDLTL